MSRVTATDGDTRVNLLEQHNPPQREAVLATEDPLLVLAGAGSGKTRTIIYRVAHLLAEHRIPPYRLLAVTFTNKAAGEMRARLDALVGPDITQDLWVGTFHATCARLLRRYYDEVGLGPRFVIYDGEPRIGLTFDTRDLLDRQALVSSGSIGLNKEFDFFLSETIIDLEETKTVRVSSKTARNE